jgi:shikimate kinase
MPKRILVCRMSFAGKSTLARLLTERFRYREVDVDETKVQRFGESADDATFSRADWKRIYHETDRPLENHLDAG